MTLECSALAFYWKGTGEPRVAGFYQVVVGWLKNIGHPPTRIGVDRKGVSGKIVNFADMEARLKTGGFADITGIELYAMDSDETPKWDYLTKCSYSQSESYAVVAARSSLATLSQASMFPLAQSMIRELKPEYGIGYTRLLNEGPDLYAVGIGVGDGLGQSESEREEALRRARWSDAMSEHLWDQGLLRDVYPWNFLTQPHLSRAVKELTLQQWITQEPERGTLQQVGEGVLMWNVPLARIADIRKELQDNDVIFNWRTHLS